MRVAMISILLLAVAAFALEPGQISSAKDAAGTVLVTDTSARQYWVPKAAGNADYDALQKWVAGGGAIAPADPPPDEKPGKLDRYLAVVTRLQAIEWALLRPANAGNKALEAARDACLAEIDKLEPEWK